MDASAPSVAAHGLPWWLPLLSVAVGPLLGLLLLRTLNGSPPAAAHRKGHKGTAQPGAHQLARELDKITIPEALAKLQPALASMRASSAIRASTCSSVYSDASASSMGSVNAGSKERRRVSRRSIDTPSGVLKVLRATCDEEIDAHQAMLTNLPDCETWLSLEDEWDRSSF